MYCLYVCISIWKQPSARDSYTARQTGHQTTVDLVNTMYGCRELLKFDPEWMGMVFIDAFRSLDAMLLEGDGTFIDTTNVKEWIVDSHITIGTLRNHRFIDDNTRNLKVCILTRNLGEMELFYSMSTLEFKINSDGGIVTSFNVIFVPIVQYTYAFVGYKWYFKEVFILELICMVCFVLFASREIIQLYKYMSKKRNPTVYATANDEGGSCGNLQKVCDSCL